MSRKLIESAYRSKNEDGLIFFPFSKLLRISRYQIEGAQSFNETIRFCYSIPFHAFIIYPTIPISAYLFKISLFDELVY